MKKSNGMLTVRGYVDPYEWDEDEEVVAVRIACDDMSHYLVEDTGKGAQLLEYVDEYVSVTGSVSKKQGHHVIKVQRFETMDAPEIDDEYDDYEDEF